VSLEGAFGLLVVGEVAVRRAVEGVSGFVVGRVGLAVVLLDLAVASIDMSLVCLCWMSLRLAS
jgi:hypothetical protein